MAIVLRNMILIPVFNSFPFMQKCKISEMTVFLFYFVCVWGVCVCVFYTEIEDACKKLEENNFRKKLPADSEDTLWVKNFVKIPLSLGPIPSGRLKNLKDIDNWSSLSLYLPVRGMSVTCELGLYLYSQIG